LLTRRIRLSAALRACAAALAVMAVSCQAEAPPRGPEEACAKACSIKAKNCTIHECERGCNLVMDRLLEHEGGLVIACIERQKTCDDRAWSHCATLVGPHADGGPPAPPLPKDFEDED
jgi:hypothetical protein